MTPKVKPLVWLKWKATEIYSADSIFGEYRISLSPVSGLWDAGIPGIGFSTNDTVELAQSAAHADHAARIIAELDPAWLAALEAQLKAADGFDVALRPFDAAVFNDNGDVTVSTGHITIGAWVVMVRRISEYRAAKEASHENG